MQIPREEVTAFTKFKTVPNVSGILHHCKKGGSRLKWNQDNFILQTSGIYSRQKVRTQYSYSSIQEEEIFAILFESK